MSMAVTPSAPLAAPDYTVRDRVATSPELAVLAALHHDPKVNLAIATTPLPEDVSRFLHKSGWQRSCFEIFKPLVTTGTPCAQRALAMTDPRNGFFYRFARNRLHHAAPSCIDYDIAHLNGATYVAFSPKGWDEFTQAQGRAGQPLLRLVTAQRDGIAKTFGNIRVDVQLRFEPALSGIVPGLWHTDRGVNHINSLFRGAQMEIIREPYVRPEILQKMSAELFTIKPKRDGRVARWLRAALGPGWDETRRIAVEPERVEKVQHGHIAYIGGDIFDDNGKLVSSGAVHRRRDALFSGARVLAVYTPYFRR